MRESDWKKVTKIVYKYGFNIKTRGFSALYIAFNIKKKYYDKLNNDEKKIIDEILNF